MTAGTRDDERPEAPATPEAPPTQEPPEPAESPADRRADDGEGAGAVGEGAEGGEDAGTKRPPVPARHIRAFIAVNLPVVVVRRIGDEVAAIKGPIARAGVKVRWVPPANIHLTLKFLGVTREEVVEGIAAALRRGVAARAPFELVARGLGAFPSPTSPRVLWAGIDEQPALAALQQDVERWMQDLGFPAEERAFHPHLTLGRVSTGGGGHGAGAEALAAREHLAFGGGRGGEVVLYESRLLGSGAEYSPLARVPLGRG